MGVSLDGFGGLRRERLVSADHDFPLISRRRLLIPIAVDRSLGAGPAPLARRR